MSFVFLSNQSLLISGVIHGTEQTERLVFDGMCVWMINDVIRLNRVGSHVVFAWIHCTDVRIHCTDILIECR